MSDQPAALRKVVWHELFPGAILFRALRLAINFRILLLAALGIVGTSAGWRVLAAVLSNPADAAYTARVDSLAHWPWQAAPITGLDLREPEGIVEVGVSGGWGFAAQHLRPPALVVRQLSDPVVALFSPTPMPLRYFLFLLLCAVWALTVWALVGGAITRIAALALAHDQQLAWGQALGFARGKWMQYFTAPLYPIVGALLAAIPLVLLGLLLRLGIGTIVAGLLWPLVILAGVFMAVLLVGLFFGWPLMWATISTEGTDSFDALSSSYAYVYQRPLHYFLYAVLAAVLAVLGWAVVAIFAGAVIDLGNWGVSWGSGQTRFVEVVQTPGDGTLTNAGGTLIRFWIRCVQLVALAFVSGYFWTAATAIYFLLRWHVDATEFDEAFTTKDEEAFGLPPLTPDAAGVPDVGDATAPPPHDLNPPPPAI